MRRAPLVVISLCLLSAPALSLESDEEYERALLSWALEQTGLQREPLPSGKVITRIDVVREEIIAESDPWPSLLNLAHVKTKERVVRRELLVRPGDRWDPELIEESERNLRKLFVLAVARLVPCRGDRPGEVVLLVVTKDLWSIRFNSSYLQVGTVLHHYEIWPTEQNFMGLNRRLSANLRLQQLDWSEGALRDSFTFGQLYVDPRVLGSRIALVEAFRATLSGAVPCSGPLDPAGHTWCPDVETGAPEGYYAQIRLERPLYSLAAQWAFDLYGAVNVARIRSFRFNAPDEVAPQGEVPGLSLRADVFSDTVSVPRVYDSQEALLTAEMTRSAGTTRKHDLTGGLTALRFRYTHPDSLRLREELLQWHARGFLPRSEEAIYLFARYRLREPRFTRLYNIQGFALSEDFTLGPDLQLEARAGADLREPVQPFSVLRASFDYRWRFAGNLASLGVAVRTRLQPSLKGSDLVDPSYPGEFFDNQFAAEAKHTSPLLWIGRTNLRARLILRRNIVDSVTWEPLPFTLAATRKVYLGSSSGLRGYASGRYEGESLGQVNAEFRTLPLNLFTLHTGLLIFYDGGVVFGGPDPTQPDRPLEPVYRHSVGLGLRAHFPQFDRESFRLDLGVPLTPDRGAWTTWFSLSFGQIF